MLTLPRTSRQQWLPLLLVLLLTSWLLIGCERTLPGSDDPAAPDSPPVVQLADEVDEQEPVDVEPAEESVDEPYPVEESIAMDDPYPITAETTPEPADTPRDEEESEEVDAAEVAEETEEAADAEPIAEAEAEAEETADAAESPATPTTHIVARGENLYRIGLQYGVSWVRLAQFNNITNPNRITVGQELRIPGPTDPIPQPTPSPHTETTYVVRAGDTLFRIGMMYGISWVQIAEANGLINPNQIFVGQELKIPVEATGPAPQFTHTVQPGDTLFRISLRYGVAWPVIAEANGLESPYVIYVGQTLVIPGG